MNNIVAKSFLYILLSFLLIISILFLVNSNYTYSNFLLTINYTLHELAGLIVFISQILFIILNSKTNNSSVLLYTLICCILYFILIYFFVEYEYINLKMNLPHGLFIYRGNLLNKDRINIFEFKIVKKVLLDIHNWDLKDFKLISSFSLFFFHISVLTFLDRINKNNIILKFLGISFVFIFNLYFWNYHFNIFLIIISFLLLKSKRESNEAI